MMQMQYWEGDIQLFECFGFLYKNDNDDDDDGVEGL